MEQEEREEFGRYLKRLREEAGLSLRDVEQQVNISNAYLSQIEKGRRNPPKPAVLKQLATAYNVTLDALMAAAGLQESDDTDLYTDRLERAFDYVRRDKKFKFGTHMNAPELTLEAKRFIVEMYEELSGYRILNPIETDEVANER